MPKKPLISAEERTQFQTAMENVTPLSSHHSIQPPKRLPAKKRTFYSDDLHPLPQKQPLPHLTPVGPEEPLKFSRPGLQTKVIQRLKRREFTIAAELDLHGFNLTEAEQSLQNFLARALAQHWQCVLIIHGKGKRSGQMPALKNSVNQWLRAYPAVLAFCSAQMRDGGAGAVYVLLKK